MTTTIKARFTHGVLEPLERVDFPEGAEFTLTISEISASTEEQIVDNDPFIKAAGGWKDTIDCDQLLKDIYESRQMLSDRPVPKL